MTDRVGIFDDFADSAIQKWETEKILPRGITPQEYFDFDIRLFGFNQSFDGGPKDTVSLERINNPSIGEPLKNNYDKARNQEKFLILACMEPFEHVARIVGKEKLLMMMAEESDKAAGLLKDSLEFTLSICQLILDKGYCFDGTWLWGDLGYEKGLIFSTDYYNTFLFDLHKEFCDFFSKNGMPVIFHTDGNVSELIPHLIEAGIRAIEPLESNVGMDLARLKKEYGRDVVLFGGVDETSFLNINKIVI